MKVVPSPTSAFQKASAHQRCALSFGWPEKGHVPLGSRLTRPTDNPHNWLLDPGGVPVMDNPNSASESCKGQDVHGQLDNPLGVPEVRLKHSLCAW